MNAATAMLRRTLGMHPRCGMVLLAAVFLAAPAAASTASAESVREVLTSTPGWVACEFRVRVRAGGVDLHPRSRACSDRYPDDAPYTMLEYDPADATFPFKRLNVPQKWWMSPRR